MIGRGHEAGKNFDALEATGKDISVIVAAIVKIQQERLKSGIRDANIKLTIFGLLSLLIGISAAVYISLQISGSLRRIVDPASLISIGDLSQEVVVDRIR